MPKFTGVDFLSLDETAFREEERQVRDSVRSWVSREFLPVLQHHVRFDRQGYPKLPSRAETHPMAEAIGLSDCYDALTTTRPYQRSRHPSDAARIIRRNAGSAYNPELVENFLAMLGTYPTGETVRLGTGEVAVVVANNPLDVTTPVVRLVIGADGQPLEAFSRVQLSDPSEERRRIIAPIDPDTKAIDVASVLELEMSEGD